LSDSYTAFVLSIYRYIFWGHLSLSLLLIVVCGYVAATSSVGQRKGRARLIAALSFTSWLVVSPLLWTLYESHLPVFEFDGVISSLVVDDSSSKHYSARLSIATTTGGNVMVHVSDRNDSLHVGQRLRVRYYGNTGELISATLFSPDGREAGVVNRTTGFLRACLVLLGLFLVGVILKRHLRDPSGATESIDRSSKLSAAVDEDSLLHLSGVQSNEKP
jgi:hypothetical protein